MPVSRQITVFNNGIQLNWENELASLPAQMRSEENVISENQRKIDELTPNLQRLNEIVGNYDGQISSINLEIIGIEAENYVREQQRQQQLQQQQHHQHHGHGSHHTTHFNVERSNYHTDSRLTDLRSRRDVLESSRRPYANERDSIQSHVSHHRSNIRNAEKKLKNLRKRSNELTSLINESRQFLGLLHNNPQSLVQHLKHDIARDLSKYDEKFAVNQSLFIRKRLRDVKTKIEFIFNDSSRKGFSPQFLADEKRYWQFKYAMISALLWRLLNEAEQQKEKKFAEYVMELLKSTHIAEQGDLPDEAAFNESRDELYQTYLQVNSEMPPMQDMQDEEVRQIENQEYNQALITAKNSAAMSSFFYNRLVSTIEKSATVKNADIPFFTKVLDAQYQVVRNPSEKNISRLGNFADQAIGAPSWKKKLGGVMLGLLGTVVIAGSIIVALATFGISSPLSAFGLVVGTTILAKGLAIGIGAIGLGSLLSGIGLFKNGMRHGLSKQIYDLNQQVKEGPKDQFNDNKQEEIPLINPYDNQPSAPSYFTQS